MAQLEFIHRHVTMPSHFHKTLMPNSAVYSNFWGSISDCHVIPKYRKIKKKKNPKQLVMVENTIYFPRQCWWLCKKNTISFYSVCGWGLAAQEPQWSSAWCAGAGRELLLSPPNQGVRSTEAPLSAHFWSRRCHWQHFHSLFNGLRTGNR